MAYRTKMNREDRAKQFMPFAALKGYEEALHRKEKIVVPKRELSEEYAQELDWKLHQIQKNDMVTVIYFQKNEYLLQTGMVSKIDESAKYLMIVDNKILFQNIYDICGERIETNRMM